MNYKDCGLRSRLSYSFILQWPTAGLHSDQYHVSDPFWSLKASLPPLPFKRALPRICIKDRTCSTDRFWGGLKRVYLRMVKGLQAYPHSPLGKERKLQASDLYMLPPHTFFQFSIFQLPIHFPRCFILTWQEPFSSTDQRWRMSTWPDTCCHWTPLILWTSDLPIILF